MKYEIIFGDEKLFDGAPERVTHVTKGGGFYCIDNGVVKFISNLTFSSMDVCELTGYLVAMRRIIKEPKRWTWEDKKAGRLPEVGCVVMAIGVNEVARIAAINNDSVCSVCVVFEDGGFSTLHFSGIAPIETPAEKAARLKSEWCANAAKQLKNLEYTSTLTSIYDALLSGELQAPKGE
jgi:hypothetical protein